MHTCSTHISADMYMYIHVHTMYRLTHLHETYTSTTQSTCTCTQHVHINTLYSTCTCTLFRHKQTHTQYILCKWSAVREFQLCLHNTKAITTGWPWEGNHGGEECGCGMFSYEGGGEVSEECPVHNGEGIQETVNMANLIEDRQDMEREYRCMYEWKNS